MSRPPLAFLAEGDPETWNSFSGCSRAAVTALRAHGAQVTTGDADLYGAAVYVAQALSFWPSRTRWVHRYHAGAAGFVLRTRRAQAIVSTLPRGTAIIQAGATFDASRPGDPFFLLCDSSAAYAQRGGAYGSLAALSRSELDAVMARERRVYHKATAIFTFTESLRQSFIDDFGVPPDRVVTTFAGPNLPRLPTDDDLQRPKQPQPTILFIGRQWERKGGPTLVAAFRRVRAAVPDARLLIVGCRPDIPPEPGVEILGLVSRDDTSERGLTNLFLTSDVYCMPSRYEPFGMTYSEAMFHGLPCIGPRTFMREIIDHEETGWLLAKDDPEELAGYLITALTDRARAKAMGATGRAKAQRLFRWDRATGIMLDVITGRGAPTT